MKHVIRFSKMHGAGNDYIYVDTSLYPIEDPSAAAIAWSNRHKGIGSDGLVLIGSSPIPEADFTMRIFNADGSEAMMCGNASRCVGKYVYEKGLTHETVIKLLTLSGVKTLQLHINNHVVESITVNMGEPVFQDELLYSGEAMDLEGCFVSMGNPHYVIFVDQVESIDVAHVGALLEHHPAFPQRCNIEFAEMRPDGIRVRVWERGSGITQACGTGACAVAVAAHQSGRAHGVCPIMMDGGTLTVEWCQQDNHIYMTGPAEFVFEGEIEVES